VFSKLPQKQTKYRVEVASLLAAIFGDKKFFQEIAGLPINKVHFLKFQ